MFGRSRKVAKDLVIWSPVDGKDDVANPLKGNTKSRTRGHSKCGVAQLQFRLECRTLRLDG